MKITALALLALCLHAGPALAFPFSFNKADPALMVEGCKDDGISLAPALAEAIARYREAHGPFAQSQDLLKVPGMSELMLKQLAPVQEDGDLSFNLSGTPGMRTY